MNAARGFATLAAGALFGFCLALCSVVRRELLLCLSRRHAVVLWLAMARGAGVTLLAYRLGPRLLGQPLLGGHFDAHGSHWDRDMLVGAAVFGVGWGLTGVCPGPAIAGLGAGNFKLLWAVAGIALGALAQGWWARPASTKNS